VTLQKQEKYSVEDRHLNYNLKCISSFRSCQFIEQLRDSILRIPKNPSPKQTPGSRVCRWSCTDV